MARIILAVGRPTLPYGCHELTDQTGLHLRQPLSLALDRRGLADRLLHG
jgi:hypothetical protein